MGTCNMQNGKMMVIKTRRKPFPSSEPLLKFHEDKDADIIF